MECASFEKAKKKVTLKRHVIYQEYLNHNELTHVFSVVTTEPLNEDHIYI